MSFSLSISLFFVVAVFYIVIIDVFTMLFRITGLTDEKARFQVISLLTNSGYSTKESELVVQVLPRRRIARTIMLFGYIFAITIVSVFVNMMLALPASEQKEIWPALIIVCSLFVVFMLVRRIPVVRIAFNSVLERVGRRLLYGNQENLILLQDVFPRGVIASVTLNVVPPLLEGKTLKELQLREKYGIHVFYTRHSDGINLNIKGSTILQKDEDVVVFGKRDAISQVFAATTGVREDTGEKAAAPETAAEYIHEEDLKDAALEAQKARAKEAEEKAHKEHPEGFELLKKDILDHKKTDSDSPVSSPKDDAGPSQSADGSSARPEDTRESSKSPDMRSEGKDKTSLRTDARYSASAETPSSKDSGPASGGESSSAPKSKDA